MRRSPAERYAAACAAIPALRDAFLVIDGPARKVIARQELRYKRDRDQAFAQWPGWLAARGKYAQAVDRAENAWHRLHPEGDLEVSEALTT